MTWYEAANAATPDQKAVHSNVASLTCVFHAVAMLSVLACVEGAGSLGDRLGTAGRRNRTAPSAMHAMC